MCAIEGLEGVKSKNNAGSNFAVKQASQAIDKMAVYDAKKAELMKQGIPEPKAIKMAEQYLKDMAGASANSGVKTNNDKDSTIGTSRQERERTEGATNVDGTAVTANNIRTGDQTNTDGNQDNMTGGGKSDTVELAKAAKESHAVSANLFSFNPALNRIAKRLEMLGVTLTEHIKKGLESLEDSDPKALKNLSEKMQGMSRSDVQTELKRLNGEN